MKGHGRLESGAVDHVVVTARDLGEGIEWVASLVGVRAAAGGRHPGWGTCNALLSLGEGSYLEVIAPDPDRPAGVEPDIFGLEAAGPPRLAAWALRVEDIAAASATAVAGGFDPGPVLAGQRERPDGVLLEWRLTDPHALRSDGVLPFLIEWHSQHPSLNAPAGCRLDELRVFSSDPGPLNRIFGALSASVRAREAGTSHLEASIFTPRGRVVLR